jgi:hypothetical protein
MISGPRKEWKPVKTTPNPDDYDRAIRKHFGLDHLNPATPSRKSNGSKTQAALSASHYCEQLAIVMGQEIPKERLLLYVNALSDLTEDQLKHGFDIALRDFHPGYGINFPYPAQLRRWCQEIPAVDLSRAILERADKPDDLTDEERRGFAAELIDELQKNIQAGKWSMPDGGYVAVAENFARDRNGKSEVPEDPAERQAWARLKEKEQGWK